MDTTPSATAFASPAALSRADRALGFLNGALASLPDPEPVAALLRRQEAVGSGRLEGIQASLLDLLDAETGLLTVGPARDVAELRALTGQLGREYAAPWCTHLEYAHDHLLRGMGQRSIGLRKSRAWIGASGATLSEATYVPPPPQEIPLLLAEWQAWLERDHDLHPLVKLALAYGQFESIHPYQDAGGRVLRIFLQHYLVAAGQISMPVLQWSDQLRREGARVHRARHALRTQHDAGPWLAMFIEVLAAAAQETATTVQRTLVLRERHRSDIGAQFGRSAGQALLVLDALVAQPMLGVKDLITLTGTSFPAANELAQRLVRAGVLAEVTGNARNRRFRYAPYVRVFIPEDLD